MKKVANAKVAQNFAEGNVLQERSETMFIVGEVIYSYGYHFPIAERIDTNKYYFTTDKYSTTTGKHKSLVLRALQKAGAEIIYKSLKK